MRSYGIMEEKKEMRGMKPKTIKKLIIGLAVTIVLMLGVVIAGPSIVQAKENKAKSAKVSVSAEMADAGQGKNRLNDEIISDELVVNEDTGSKALAAAIAVGLAAAAGAIGMGVAIAKSAEGISRQPEAEGSIRTTLMLGLVFIETAIIYALIVAILIIFVM